MVYEIHTTPMFENWVRNLKDRRAMLAIAKRLDRAMQGNLGDVVPLGGGVSEMRVFVGQGYRLYFTLRGNKLVILLCGGDKSSQQRDIEQAKMLAKTV